MGKNGTLGEKHGSYVRLRTSIPPEAFERFQKLAAEVGIPVERMIGLAAVQALPTWEAKIAIVLDGERRMLAGDVAQVAPASGAVASEHSASSETRPVLSAIPARGAGRGKPKGRH